MTKVDLRVKKTKMMIRNGFFSCIKKKKFSKITIAELCEAMIINKSTFYKYYYDKYDLRESIVNETLVQFRENLDLSYLSKSNNKLREYKETLPASLTALKDQKEILLLLWSPHLEYDVQSKMEQIIFEEFSHLLQHQNNKLTKLDNLYAHIFAASTLQTLKWWFITSPATSSEEVADIIIKSLGSGIDSAFINS